MTTHGITRASITAEQRNTDLWAEVDISSWEATERDRYERLKSAILAYLEGESLKNIKKWHAVASQQLLDQLARCITPNVDGRLNGWRGLIKNARVKDYERHQTKLVWTGKSGLSGSFKQLLSRYPKMAQELRNFILKKQTKRDRIEESGISFKGVMDKFIGLCGEFRIQPDEYPFNTPSQGSSSLRKFAHAVRGASFAVGAK
jgi:putative transposase